MPNHKIKSACGFLFLAIAIASPTVCWSEQADQTIFMEADAVDINEKKGISIYKGKVKMSRGDITILADEITAYKDSTGLTRLVALGSPVDFTKAGSDIGNNVNNNRPEQKPTHGEALKIEYDAKKEILKLITNAKLWQANDQFSGNLIVYDVTNESIAANKGSANKGRIKVIIHPVKKAADQ